MTLTLQIIPFKSRHVPQINPEASDDTLAMARLAERAGNAFTACVLGDPIGAAGIAVTSPREAEVWTLFSPFLCQCFAKSMFKHCKELMNEVIRSAGIELVTAVINPNEAKSVRFITRMGFTYDRPYEEFHIYTRGSDVQP